MYAKRHQLPTVETVVRLTVLETLTAATQTIHETGEDAEVIVQIEDAYASIVKYFQVHLELDLNLYLENNYSNYGQMADFLWLTKIAFLPDLIYYL